MPTTSHPVFTASMVAAEITELIPGAGPPPHRIPTLCLPSAILPDSSPGGTGLLPRGFKRGRRSVDPERDTPPASLDHAKASFPRRRSGRADRRRHGGLAVGDRRIGQGSFGG